MFDDTEQVSVGLDANSDHESSNAGSIVGSPAASPRVQAEDSVQGAAGANVIEPVHEPKTDSKAKTANAQVPLVLRRSTRNRGSAIDYNVLAGFGKSGIYNNPNIISEMDSDYEVDCNTYETDQEPLELIKLPGEQDAYRVYKAKLDAESRKRTADLNQLKEKGKDSESEDDIDKQMSCLLERKKKLKRRLKEQKLQGLQSELLDLETEYVKNTSSVNVKLPDKKIESKSVKNARSQSKSKVSIKIPSKNPEVDSRGKGFDLNELRSVQGLQDRALLELSRLGFQGSESSDDEEESTLGRSVKGKPTRSGLEAKALDYVLYPQVWPHMKLQFEYCGRDIKFADLNFQMLVAGELEIISSARISPSEKAGRLGLLKEIVYNKGTYEWETIRKFYASVLRRIETGEMDWTSDFSRIQTIVLATGSRPQLPKRPVNVPAYPGKNVKFPQSRSEGGRPSGNNIWFCRPFQRNRCTFSESSHSGSLRNGSSVTFQHICATCWQKDQSKSYHPECSSACPNANQRGQAS